MSEDMIHRARASRLLCTAALFGAIQLGSISAKGGGSSDEDALVLAARTIESHRLTSLPIRCLAFEMSPNNEETGNVFIRVREKHDRTCGGDPATSPRLFDLRIDLQSAVISTDAGSVDGKFHILEGSRK